VARKRRDPHRERMVGGGRMRQFIAYARTKLKLVDLAMRTVEDSRRAPRIEGAVCVLLGVIMLLRRCRSFNAFEKPLQARPMKKLFRGYRLPRCTQTIKDAFKKMDLQSLEVLHQALLKEAAGNKAFDMVRMHDQRFFGFDGVEPLSSRKRSCGGCQTRTVQTTQGDVVEYFHRYVFLQSIGPVPHLLLGFQHQDNLEHRKAKDSEAVKAEGELTAVKLLVDRLRSFFPRLYSVGVGDSLYANGPMFVFMRAGDFPLDLIAVLKKETDEPMADAIEVFARMEPTETYYDEARGEHVRMWDSEGFEGLSTCPYPLRVIKALAYEGPPTLIPDQVDWTGEDVHTWWLATGITKERLSGPQVFDGLRHRWDEENCAFNELTQHWHFKHAYLHHEVGTQVMMYAFMIAYNLFQLFLHRCLRGFRYSRETAIGVADDMRDDHANIRSPQDGFFPFDTS